MDRHFGNSSPVEELHASSLVAKLRAFFPFCDIAFLLFYTLNTVL